jgi:hypothetical protein
MPLIAFLGAAGAFCYGLGHLIDALSNAGFFHWLNSIEWSAILGWFHSAHAAQIPPQPSLGNEALYDQFQQLMDTQFQIGELKRHMLTMPALPNEGF